MKWTLDSWPGQRQWMESEANVVLEDLRTNAWVYDDVRQVEKKEKGGDEEVVKEEAGRNEGEEEERGGVAAAVFDAAAGLVFGFDEADEVPFLDDKITEDPNEDAEETETCNQAKAQDSVDGGEKVILASSRPYTCGRCSKSIDLDSTFYRCVGHSCWGAFMARQSWIF